MFIGPVCPADKKTLLIFHKLPSNLCVWFSGVFFNNTHFYLGDSMNLYVGNLSYDMTDEDLQQVFEEYGTVNKVNIIMDRDSGRSKGFGFVEMENSEDGEKAVQELDGQEVKGRNLKVNQARPREEKPRRQSW